MGLNHPLRGVRLAWTALFLTACSSEPVRTTFQDAEADAGDAASDISAVDARADSALDASPDAAPDAQPDAAQPDVAADVADAATDRGRVPRDVPDFEDGGIAGPTYDFVLTQLLVDPNIKGVAPNPATATVGLAGFNLDERFTGSVGRDPSECNHGDFFSTLDPDQNMGTCSAGTARGGASCMGGVDNQLPDIADTVGAFGADIRDTINQLTANGRMSILVRLSGVEGTPGPTLDDDQVTLRVYTIGRPMFTDCRRIGTPGNAYAVDDASLTTPGDLARARFRFNARIVHGRVMTIPTGATAEPDFTFDLPLGGPTAPLSLYRTQLRFNLGEAGDSVAAGNLGGATPLREISDAVVPMIPSGISPSVVNAVLQSFVDIQDPLGDPTGCRLPNGSIGLGMGFTGVRAVIQSTSVRGAQPGMCGS